MALRSSKIGRGYEEAFDVTGEWAFWVGLKVPLKLPGTLIRR
jgi:hypothetical protein